MGDKAATPPASGLTARQAKWLASMAASVEALLRQAWARS
jgi:hypothetical protein